jgi:plastocyanin
MQPLTSLLALAALASAATVSINVGEVGISFDPDSATAAVGDTLEFHFYTGTGPHSVVHAAFANPCVPGPDAFFSGLMAGNEDGSEVFTVPVTSKDPIVRLPSAGGLVSGFKEEG